MIKQHKIWLNDEIKRKKIQQKCRIEKLEIC
jgi:hypothetical protein